MRVEIDENRCCGSGSCVLVAPELFDQREHDGVVTLVGRPAEWQRDAVQDAVSRCPSGALRLVD